MGGPTVNPTVTELLVPLAEVTDRGLYQDDSFVSWADHIAAGAQLAAALRARLDPTRPPHVGALLGNTTFFSSLLVAAGLDGLVPVGLNQTRRGEALARDIAHADCQLVLADSSVTVPPGVEYIDVESADWAAELASYHGTPVRFAELSADDLFMLIFTSGTGGDPKAVRVTHDKVAFPGRMLAERFGLGPADTVYLSMPLFHSNAIMAGWAVAAAAGASIALRRKFSASGFMPDIRRFGATYANYVGKPLSYILASEPAPDDADNPLRILYGNEGSPPDLGRFAERFGVTVVDGFGSTEGGVAIARTPDTPEGALGPLTDQVAIVDVETGQACPPGVVGELVNPTGAGWFRGYYNDPDAEAARMTGGVYHTGDLAYLDEFGYAHFAGRLGDWMRVDGENLGTAPIERILLRYPGVAEVAVYPIPDPNVGDQVMAALVLGADTAFEAEKFRAFLHEQPDLGPKQWPSYVRIGAALPRTETFKVIKRQLSAEGTDCADPVWPISR
ncbi:MULTISPECIES: long-chain-fatty-acid--CoA ligase FadD17 [unclassified Mycolicibacterium]|uniref:long-chain-fatty-acid--CoA ligase FadD17 n=1 Tax=unclassified Mycolicibacterium TaxID=2636767 RepID=UPI0012DC2C6F|nr:MULTISPECIES: long-chain-fatty-acid--CoA ligase FadD17 [unclassified Mycolicibacterium]MUL83930.1 AMP-binding protein [Mycolicibacterium sp. CBMA 329]MUL90004.1 AMP-binding protein [Mycolicibacterium sp. CBMA 331]MUL97975.1 AMP-binding protein [Mycolicibacterium sp. CBMA 334]MUM39519.1 AMP-binding protein [Mycolicibacterium sp. CBMA 247]MUM46605.1 AMP-binding protein [Mycolicibacterium sp. CBMA 294]